MKLTKRNLKKLIQEEINNLYTESQQEVSDQAQSEDEVRASVRSFIENLEKIHIGLSDIIISRRASGHTHTSLTNANALIFNALNILDPPDPPEDSI